VLGGYLWDFTRSALSLIGALGLAWLLLRALGKRGAGLSSGPLRVVQRLSLEPRARLYVVQAGERTLLIGAADGAAPTLLTELPVDAQAGARPLGAVAAGPSAAVEHSATAGPDVDVAGGER
jgi:flagellar biogenesis protein FliO